MENVALCVFCLVSVVIGVAMFKAAVNVFKVIQLWKELASLISVVCPQIFVNFVLWDTLHTEGSVIYALQAA